MDPDWTQWRELRPIPINRHLDSAAAGRMANSVRRVIDEHLHREAEVGTYIAQAEAQPVLEHARADLAREFGHSPNGVAFVESATAALSILLRAWGAGPGHRVGVLAGEWGTNVAILLEHGIELVAVPADPHGRIDLDQLEGLLRREHLDALHLSAVSADRGLRQPLPAIAALTRAAGVPLWIDASQALGHVDVSGADVAYSGSRKWLAGPRGVGVLSIAESWWPVLRVRHHMLADPDEPTVRALESDDGNLAGRVGLAAAVREYLGDDRERVWARLDDVGRTTRRALADLPGWRVVEPIDAGTAITTLAPTKGQDVVAERARLLAAGILTTASLPIRTPRDRRAPTLRLSPHVDCSTEDLHAVADVISVTNK